MASSKNNLDTFCDPSEQAKSLLKYRVSKEDMESLSSCFCGFPDSIPVGVKIDKKAKTTCFAVHDQTKKLLSAAMTSRKEYVKERDSMIAKDPLPDKFYSFPCLREDQLLGDLVVSKRLGNDSTQGKVFLMKHRKNKAECALKASPLASPGVYELFSAVNVMLEGKNNLVAEKHCYVAFRLVHAPRDIASLFKKDSDKKTPRENIEKAREWLVKEIRRSWFDLETEPTIEALNAFVTSKLVSEGKSFFHPRMIACFRGFEPSVAKYDKKIPDGVSKHTTTGKVAAIREAFLDCKNNKIDEAIVRSYVPMQYLVMEKLDGFLSKLPTEFYGRGKDFRWDRLAMVLAQLCAGLALGQKYAGFKSNDAHWGNIGYFKVPSDSILRIVLPEENGHREVLEIPTGGILLCIIDGGRCSVDIYGGTLSFASGFMELYGLKDVTINNESADLVRTAWECTKLLRDRDVFDWGESSNMIALNATSPTYMRSYTLKWDQHRNMKGNAYAEACVGIIQTWRTVMIPENYETLVFAKVNELIKTSGGRYTTLDHDIDRKAVREAVMTKERLANKKELMSSKQPLELSKWLRYDEKPAKHYPMDLDDYRRSIKKEYMDVFAKSDEFAKMNSSEELTKKRDDFDYQAVSDAVIFSTVDYRAKAFSFRGQPLTSLRTLTNLFGQEQDPLTNKIVFTFTL